MVNLRLHGMNCCKLWSEIVKVRPLVIFVDETPVFVA